MLFPQIILFILSLWNLILELLLKKVWVVDGWCSIGFENTISDVWISVPFMFVRWCGLVFHVNLADSFFRIAIPNYFLTIRRRVNIFLLLILCCGKIMLYTVTFKFARLLFWSKYFLYLEKSKVASIHQICQDNFLRGTKFCYSWFINIICTINQAQ